MKKYRLPRKQKKAVKKAIKRGSIMSGIYSLYLEYSRMIGGKAAGMMINAYINYYTRGMFYGSMIM